MDNLKIEDVCKRYLATRSKTTSEIAVCFDVVLTILGQIRQAADNTERKEDVACFVQFLVQTTANQLVALNELINETLLMQLKAELSMTQLPFEFEREADVEQVP